MRQGHHAGDAAGRDVAITAPVASEADTVDISTVVSAIESLEQTRVVAKPDIAAAFGSTPRGFHRLQGGG